MGRWFVYSNPTAMVVLLMAIAAAANKLGNDLPKEIEEHKFVFVVGSHHSGTTLTDLIIGEHELASPLKGTGKAADEGQHLQKVYKSAHQLGGLIRYAFNKESYMQEDDKRVTPENRMSLYNSWAKFWNTSKPYLVEKSPRHITMTRFLQELFTRERTFFVVIMRHPLGAFDFVFKQFPSHRSVSCGSAELRQWLTLHDNLVRDIRHLNNVVVLQFEQLLGLSHNMTQTMVDDLFRFLKLPQNVEVDIDDTTSETAKFDNWYAMLRKRRPKWFDKDGRYIENPLARVSLEDGYRPANYNPDDYFPPPRGVRKGKAPALGKATGGGASASSGDNKNNKEGTGDAADDDGNGGTEAGPKTAPNTAALDSVILHTQNELEKTNDTQQAQLLQQHLQQLQKARQQLLDVGLDRDRIDDDDDDDGLALGSEEEQVEDTKGAGEGRRRRLSAAMTRHLLFYYGDAHSRVQVHTGSVFDWTKRWEDTDWSSPQCARVLNQYEPRLIKYGYSLKNLSHFEAPQAFKEYLLHPY